MSNNITLNSPQCDWLTFTSCDYDLMHLGMSIARYTAKLEDSTIMQYKGVSATDRNGNSIFVGAGEQNGNTHYLCRISGALAHEKHALFYELVALGKVNVSRIDFQVTIEQPVGWSQVELFNRLREGGSKSDFRSSVDGFSRCELASVDYGSRTSAEYLRIYEKVTREGRRLLRAEVEYKSKKAVSAFLAMSTDYNKVAQGIKYRLGKTKDEQLVNAFADGLDCLPAKIVPVTNDIDKREHWLLGAVVPALKRYLSETHDLYMRDIFQGVLDDFTRYTGEGYYEDEDRQIQ